MPFRPIVAAVVLIAVLLPGAARAEPEGPSPERLVALAAALRQDFVLPRYRDFATATDRQQAAWRTVCADGQGADTAPLLAALGAASDAWAAIEVIRAGPVAEESRYERIQHWPERRNAIARGLAGLSAKPESDAVAPAEIAQASAAVQGLSALERLLTEPAPKGAAARAARSRCAVGTAIATHLAGVAAAIRDGWAAPGAPGTDPDPAATRALLGRVATDMLTLYRLIEQAKIGLPLGRTAEDAKPASAEMARTGRSARIVAINLASLEALTEILVGPDQEGRSLALATAGSARSIAETMPGDLGPLAAGPKTRSRVVLLAAAVASAREAAQAVVPAALGIKVGFNALDGD